MPDDTHSTPPSAAPPALTATSTKTPPIALAIRDEIRLLVDVEVLDLKLLADVVGVARSGRELVAVRNPISRFDAKAQGLASGPPMGEPSMPFICTDDDLDDCGYGGYMDPIWKGNGPGVRGARERKENDVRTMLKDSPLAKAAKAEILELTAKDSFGASDLMQVEQLASHTHRLLSARLGLSQSSSRRPMLRNNYGPYAGGQMAMPLDPYSSPETYGATVTRELAAALAPKKPEVDPEKLVLAIAQARNAGMHDLAAKLETQLTGESAPTHAAPTSASPGVTAEETK